MGRLFLMTISITPTGFRLETMKKGKEQFIQKEQVENKGNSSMIAGMPLILLHFSFVMYEFSKLTESVPQWSLGYSFHTSAVSISAFWWKPYLKPIFALLVEA
ncbi:hypothetical protein F3Y22_tig00112443pilonHSYRG00132 [Hibiscus syriacus]|uniref:Uncharacterized protein n=1 Tax=Hibiscus syriacus TaxID=106335 RepID=A0A6A2WZH6_HIBSY|nr:hypothetical protein F3Y22_tig00112443pilonHSYRG00132 [Hibiscus syriacus]